MYKRQIPDIAEAQPGKLPAEGFKPFHKGGRRVLQTDLPPHFQRVVFIGVVPVVDLADLVVDPAGPFADAAVDAHEHRHDRQADQGQQRLNGQGEGQLDPYDDQAGEGIGDLFLEKAAGPLGVVRQMHFQQQASFGEIRCTDGMCIKIPDSSGGSNVWHIALICMMLSALIISVV